LPRCGGRDDRTHGPAIDSRPARIAALHGALKQRILVLDGAMGTMIQRYGLTEAQYRGERFRISRGTCAATTTCSPSRGRSDPRDPCAVPRAGADILETNTFNSTSISQADYHLEDVRCRDEPRSRRDRARGRRFVQREDARKAALRRPASSGPMNRTLSLSPDVNDPGYRAVSFDQVKDAYKVAVKALVEGGVDIISSRRSSTP
jgi:5-methyltetrahydrofolate--homocysteine methyltransferase